ncbi:MAG TPA: dual specificity protein phosphatase family protein [Humisphaera sp.]|jgi:protein phosphatase|nr:dual specificity protein phosphatase family protein [Humisphaera sp.]
MSNLGEPFTPNPRIGGYYAAGALLLIGLSFARVPMTLPLLWPAGSLTIVVAGYLFLGPRVYRKRNGKLPWTTWLLLWPVLFGQRLSLIHYARRCNPYDRLTDHLWIGRHLTEREAQQARDAGITAVLDLASEFSEPPAMRRLAYLQLNILDLTSPTPAQIEQAITFIQSHSANGIVYIHCKIGYSRTAAIAGAYLMACGLAENPEQAIAMLGRARHGIIIRREAVAAIHDYQARL